MPVSRAQILARGLRLRCPNCGGATLFPPGRRWSPAPRCPACGCRFDRGEGFFLGSMTINYGVTVFGILAPLVALGAAGLLPWRAVAALALVTAVAGPILLFRPARSWWLMCYFLVLPHLLPANRPPDAEPPSEGE